MPAALPGTHYGAGLEQTNGFRIAVDIKSDAVTPVTPSSRPSAKVVLRNLAYSLDGLYFSDTKFLLFSRRRQVNGVTVSRPSSCLRIICVTQTSIRLL